MQKNMKPLVSVSLITLIFFFVATEISVATEYLCTCKKKSGHYFVKENFIVKEDEKISGCSEKKWELILEYEEGFISLGAVDGTWERQMDIVKETNSFVKAEAEQEGKNHFKINFNKNSRTLRHDVRTHTHMEAIWNGDKIVFPERLSDYKILTTFSCKKTK